MLAMPLLVVVATTISIGLKYRQASLDSALITAIQDRKSDRAIQLLNQGANANATDDPDRPTTFQAMLSEFLRRFRDGAKPQQSRNSALILACIEEPSPRYGGGNDPKLFEVLLEHGAKANTCNADRTRSALDFHAMFGSMETVSLLLKYGADPNWIIERPPINYATNWARLDIAKVLLDHGANINGSDRTGWTALHLAVRRPIHVLNWLISNHADVNARNQDGDTPLMTASSYSLTQPVRVLIENGADVSIKDNNGQTAINIAKGVKASREKREIVGILTEAAKQPPNRPDPDP